MPSEDQDIPWNLVSHLKASTTREQVLFELYDNPVHAAEVAEKFNKARGTISNHIRWMKKSEPPLVKCLTPERPHHRIYGVTDEGRKVVEHLSRQQRDNIR